MTPEQRTEVVGRLDEALGLLRSIHPAIAALHVGVMDPTSGLRQLVINLSTAVQDGQGGDPKVIAAEIAKALPGDFAQQVADELHRRLAS